MSTIRNLMLAVAAVLATTMTMAQNGFNYQAVIRNNGEVVSNQDVTLRISIMNGDAVCYQETQKTKTNAYGNISVSVGEGEPKTGSFATIPWETMQIMMQIEVSTDGTENYVNLGQMQIQPVPYTMYAARTTTVIQPKEATEDPIFEVRDSEGELLFAVYETGVKVFVDEDGSKAAKSKFAVAGRSVSKGEENLLAIDADGTTVFVDDNADKAAKSRFAVAERSAKGDNNIITIDGSGSTIYVSDEGKAAKSKFAVAERSAKGKKLGNNYSLDGDGSTVYVDFDDTLIVRGKVNAFLMMFLYQAFNQGKRLCLLTRHSTDIFSDLEKACIPASLFSEIIRLDEAGAKTDYIAPDSIFIDDSFSERKRVRDALGIPVFDLDMVESLIDWRS